LSHFSLRYSPSEELKLIISVSKKVAKKAVDRNLIKRRVRAILRKPSPLLKPGTYLFITRSGALDIKGEALKSELEELLKKR
jgi:ribonuclease P protein component